MGSQAQVYLSGGSELHVSGAHQQEYDVAEQPLNVPQMEPVEFREMIDDIMAISEQQAAQVHKSGGAAALESSSAAALHPIWEDEEVCLEGHDSPCVATIGLRARD